MAKKVGALAALVLTIALLVPASGSAKVARERVIVGYRPGTDVAAVVRAVGGRVTYRYQLIRGAVAEIPAGALADLRRESGIAWVQRDVVRTVRGLYAPESVYEGSPEFMPWGVRDVQADDVWDADHDLRVDAGAPAGQGVRVAVIDNGYDRTHPDLASAWDLQDSACFLFEGCTPQDDLQGEYQGHGVAAASNIGARANGVGIIGVAPRTTIVAYRAGDSETGYLTTSATTAAIERAILDDVDVINMSYGGVSPSPAERKMLEVAHARGIVLVASSGNGKDHGAPVSVQFPAKLPTVIGVGAVDETNTIADFSSRGNGLELVGPGVQVPVALVQGTAVDSALEITSPASAGPFWNAAIEFSATGSASGPVVYVGTATADELAGLDLTGKIALIQRGSIAFGEKVANAAAAGAEAAILFNNVAGPIGATLGAPGTIPALEMTGEDGQALLALVGSAPVTASVEVANTDWASWNGTSFSAPHVAGVAALLLSVDPDLTPAQVEEALTTTATDLGKPGYDTTYGYGLVNACAAVAAVGGDC